MRGAGVLAPGHLRIRPFLLLVLLRLAVPEPRRRQQRTRSSSRFRIVTAISIITNIVVVVDGVWREEEGGARRCVAAGRGGEELVRSSCRCSGASGPGLAVPVARPAEGCEKASCRHVQRRRKGGTGSTMNIYFCSLSSPVYSVFGRCCFFCFFFFLFFSLQVDFFCLKLIIFFVWFVFLLKIKSYVGVSFCRFRGGGGGGVLLSARLSHTGTHILHGTVRVRHHTMLYHALLYHTMLHYTIPYCIIPDAILYF